MPDLATLLPIALRGLAPIGSIAFGAWIASLVRRDASLVDRAWSLMIAGPALVYASQTSWTSPRAIAVQVLVLAWALRLAAYITWRNWGHGEDRRYQAIRARNEPHFALKSLVLVFGLQMVLAWIVSAPTLAALAGGGRFGALDAAGIAVALGGFLFEAIGDAQMAAFRRDAAHRGQVMDRGLWRYTRHPNYFGEACFWWGVWLLALAAGGLAAAWTVASPLLMTVLLLKVSGVAMLERDIGERRPAYSDYVARTNAFIPGPPRQFATGPASPSSAPRPRAHKRRRSGAKAPAKTVSEDGVRRRGQVLQCNGVRSCSASTSKRLALQDLTPR